MFQTDRQTDNPGINIALNQPQKGFTLAEVLVTLAIIGVVAALTIPTLITSMQENQLKIAFKKVYSDLNQVTLKVINDYGSTQGICHSPPFAGCGSATELNKAYSEIFSSYMIYAKYCDGGESIGKCWTNDTIKYLNGNPADNPVGSSRGVVLNNGVFIIFSDYYYAHPSGQMHIDVNGFKGPNQYGKDIFVVRINPQGLVPRGFNGDSTGCIADSPLESQNRGLGCAAKVLLNINY